MSRWIHFKIMQSYAIHSLKHGKGFLLLWELINLRTKKRLSQIRYSGRRNLNQTGGAGKITSKALAWGWP